MHISPITPAVGAEVTGVDLTSLSPKPSSAALRPDKAN